MYQRAEGTLRAGGSLLRTRLSCDPAPVPARVPEPPRPAPSRAHRPALRAAGRCRRRPGKTLPRRFSVKTSLPCTRTPRKHDRGEQRLPLAPGKPASWFRAGRDPGPAARWPPAREGLVSFQGRCAAGASSPRAGKGVTRDTFCSGTGMEWGAPGAFCGVSREGRAAETAPALRHSDVTRSPVPERPPSLTTARQRAQRARPAQGAVSPGLRRSAPCTPHCWEQLSFSHTRVPHGQKAPGRETCRRGRRSPPVPVHTGAPCSPRAWSAGQPRGAAPVPAGSGPWRTRW